MKLRYSFGIEKIGEKYIAITIDKDAGKYPAALRVNEYGMMLIKLLQNDVSKEDLVNSMKAYFDDTEDMKQQIDSFLEVLNKENLLI